MSTTPSYQQDVAQSPKTIVLHFDQYVKFPSLEVLNVHGKDYTSTVRAVQTNVIAAVKTLPTGDYTVRWHAPLGGLARGLGRVRTVRGSDAGPAADRGLWRERPDPDRECRALRLYFLALALVIGSLGFHG